MHRQRAEHALDIADRRAAEAFFRACFAPCDPATETLFVAHLDAIGRCLHLSRHDGDSCSAGFPVRLIVADALAFGSTGLVLAHNHPSGNAEPSATDCRATRRLATVAEAIGCTVVDHLVFGGEGCTSFRTIGLI